MENTTEHIVSGMQRLQQNVGVVSTVSASNSPEAAAVYFSYDADLNIYFTTRKSSRKFSNIQQNPSVAFVVFNLQTLQTIQLEGIASIVEDPLEQNQHFSSIVKLAHQDNELPIDQMGESEIMFMKISTHWVRMGNFQATRNGSMFEVLAIA